MIGNEVSRFSLGHHFFKLAQLLKHLRVACSFLPHRLIKREAALD